MRFFSFTNTHHEFLFSISLHHFPLPSTMNLTLARFICLDYGEVGATGRRKIAVFFFFFLIKIERR